MTFNYFFAFLSRDEVLARWDAITSCRGKVMQKYS